MEELIKSELQIYGPIIFIVCCNYLDWFIINLGLFTQAGNPDFHKEIPALVKVSPDEEILLEYLFRALVHVVFGLVTLVCLQN